MAKPTRGRRPTILCALLLVLAGSPAMGAQPGEPTSGADWYSLGRSLQDQRRYDDALAAFQHAIDLQFQPAGALMRMAQIDAAEGRRDRALARLERASAFSPAALALLPGIGGVPELAGDPRLQALMDKAEQARYPCDSNPKARELDFWLGDWDVSNPQGQRAGENHVTRDLRGCVIREAWTDAYGDRGTSVNFYDPATARWHQVWTSDNGTVTHYQGVFADGAMRFAASGFGDADGQTHFRRMTFTPNEDGTVRQLIEDSSDGEHWSVSFDGRYRRQQPH